MQALPFYSVASLDKAHPFRGIKIPTTNDSLMIASDDTPLYGEGFYILVTGAPLTAGLQVAQVTITTGIEFNPTGEYIPICHMDLPEPGQATSFCLSNIVAMRPSVQSLAADSVLELFRTLPSRTGHHDQVLNTFARLPMVI